MRCKYKVSRGGNIGVCKREAKDGTLYCTQHREMIGGQMQEMVDKEMYNTFYRGVPEVGICCFCAEKCNPFSQSCGKCARNMSIAASGWR